MVALFVVGCGSDATGPSTSTAPVPGEPPPYPDPEPPAPNPSDCEEFDSTYGAIQELVFERKGCTAEACHGNSGAGGLDLRADVAIENLIDAPSVGSRLARIVPKQPLKSYLFLKLAAATDPQQLAGQEIVGSPMPLSGNGLTEDQLEAMRIWIEAGAPATGAVTGNAGRGSGYVGDLLGACLPEADPVEVAPLPIPAADEGVQLVMPPHPIAAGGEVEICFASYFDFSDQIPTRYLDETGDFYYAQREEKREDPNTHHIIVMKPSVDLDLIHDLSYGGWVCADGGRAEEVCDPLQPSDCPDSLCRTHIFDSVTCGGFGPAEGRPNGGINFDETYLIPEIKTKGFFTKLPVRGLVYWNSHAFNLTTKDTLHRVWRNFYFTDDLQFQMTHFNHFFAISAGAGTEPFTKKTVCSTRTFEPDEQILYLASHTHKRGEFFWIENPDGDVIYESPFYDDPLFKSYDPPLQYTADDPAGRTVTYCATYNNGVNDDGSPNVDTVTRLSRKPARSSCTPVACAEGRIGAPCAGTTDHVTCDTEPGDGDGLCDACQITGGLTTDDEMFVMLGGTASTVE
ncbi:MAG: hypothetical protein P8R42_20870 [Candidatus Binatia bacterium]|nr:hypothetical protein [Candidatus Binatia bacterium]